MFAQIRRGLTRAEESQDSEREVRASVTGDGVPTRADVTTDPQRARLYERLRRRFPLRIAVPR